MPQLYPTHIGPARRHRTRLPNLNVAMAATIKPLKIAILGGGPSSFYCASRILSRLPHSSPEGQNVQVHVYDRLWAPHGLVRYGVAPDHPEVKVSIFSTALFSYTEFILFYFIVCFVSQCLTFFGQNCTHKFNETAKDPRFRFFGNVNVGDTPSFPHALHLPLRALFPHYTHLIISNGATLPVILPQLGNASTPALSLVHWYTAHPSQPPPPRLEAMPHMTLLGHGNVSLDIARMMFSPPERLAPLDLPEHVVEKISNTSVRHISIVSRRGPAEAAFTAKELRELLTLPRAAMIPIPEELLVPPPNATRQQKRILDLLRKGSTTKTGETSYTWSLKFFRSPTKVTQHTNEYTTIEYDVNQLDAQKRAVPTGEMDMQRTHGVVGSIGYRSEPIEPAWFNGGLGRTRNVIGRVFNEENRRVQGVYSSGWASNGAKGVLATTMMDAYSVAETLLTDHFQGETNAEPPVEILNSDPRPGGPPEVEHSTARVISYDDWIRIDEEEIRRGQARKKERERMVWADVIKFLS